MRNTRFNNPQSDTQIDAAIEEGILQEILRVPHSSKLSEKADDVLMMFVIAGSNRKARTCFPSERYKNTF